MELTVNKEKIIREVGLRRQGDQFVGVRKRTYEL